MMIADDLVPIDTTVYSEMLIILQNKLTKLQPLTRYGLLLR